MNLKLKTKILERGRSQKDVARALNIHDTRLSEFVQEWKEPDREMKEAIASELGCQVEDLF